MAKFNLTVAGWLFIITTIGALVLTYKNKSDLKKLMRSSKTTVQNTSQVDEEQETD